MNVLVTLFLIAYLYSLHVAPFIKRRYPSSKMNALHEQCVATSSSVPKWMLGGRGGNYILDSSNESSKLQGCVLTFWGLSHFALYFAVGMFCPQYAVWASIIGVLFEVYEWWAFDCADPLDILWNALGLVLGTNVHRL